MLTVLRPDDLAEVKRGFSTRRVPIADMQTLIRADGVRPRAGDLVLARVDALGHHSKLERPDGRRTQMHVGDRIIACYGHRYAPDQFEAAVPEDLGGCDLVAAGGIAAVALSWHRRIAAPTRIEPLGLIGDAAGARLNVARYALPARPMAAWTLPTLLVAGESMNAGKSTTAAALVRGLVQAGHRVGAIKVTGTGAGGDLWLLQDAGAAIVVDFTDAGFATTHRMPVARLEDGIERLISHVAAAACTAVVVEIADGVLQAETAALLRGRMLPRLQAGVMFACGGAAAGAYGVAWLQAAGYQVLGLAGIIEQSPLAMREAEQAAGLRCFGPQTLARPEIALAMLAKRPSDGRLEIAPRAPLAACPAVVPGEAPAWSKVPIDAATMPQAAPAAPRARHANGHL